jgi:hypothetical protein
MGMCKSEFCLVLIICSCELNINWFLFLETNIITDSVYSNLTGFIKEIGNYNSFMKELKQFLFLLIHKTFYSVEEFLSCCCLNCDIFWLIWFYIYNIYINNQLYLELMCVLFKWLCRVFPYFVSIILTADEFIFICMIFGLNKTQ